MAEFRNLKMPVHVSFNQDATRAAVVFAESPGNVLTEQLVRALRATLGDLAEERHLRLVTIEGAGRDFSFGASLQEHLPDDIARVLPEMHGLIVDLLELPIPTAAVVRGRCLGGGFELALACDVVFASDLATFGLPEIAIGAFPPAGCVLLPARVGYGRASAAILTGEPRPAAFWHAAGLVEEVIEEEEMTATLDAWFTRTLARHSAASLRQATRALRAPLLDLCRTGLPRVEQLYLTELIRAHDATEGVRAFLDKRVPRWTDS
jgi:cyclohexa-1,5-dienecarbonyl-CoA hydratase